PLHRTQGIRGGPSMRYTGIYLADSTLAAFLRTWTGTDAGTESVAQLEAVLGSVTFSGSSKAAASPAHEPNALRSTVYPVSAQPYSMVSAGGFIWAGVYDGDTDAAALDKIDP